MSDQDQVLLSEDQRKSMEMALRWDEEALRTLGLAALRHENARLELEASQRELALAAGHARLARAQHDEILRLIGSVLQLPPGQWRFDPVDGLLKKE